MPTRRGGYCYQLELAFGGCRQTAADRNVGKRGQLGVTYQVRGGTRPGYPIVSRIGGDLTAPDAASITVHYAGGATHDVPFVWVSKPIAAGFYSYDIPTSHWNAEHRVVSVTLQSADGHRLAIQRFPYRRPIRRPLPIPPRLVTPKQRPLPARPALTPSRPLQRGSADGVTVTVGRNGAVQFTATAQTPLLRRLTGHSAGFSCFRLTREFGIFTVRETSSGGRFARDVGIQVDGVSTPFDGCEIQGSAGHRWPDVHSSHSAVEVDFTATGRAFFTNRAAARDLALFVRSRRVHQIRREPPATAIDDLHAAYGAELAHSRIRVSADGRDLVFGETSPTGKRFTLTVRDGRIVKQNLKPYAFAF